MSKKEIIEEFDEENIFLFDENGQENEFEVIATLEVDENEYTILLPVGQEDKPEEEVEAFVLRIEKDETGEEVLVGIDDDAELDMVIEAYEELMSEEAN